MPEKQPAKNRVQLHVPAFVDQRMREIAKGEGLTLSEAWEVAAWEFVLRGGAGEQPAEGGRRRRGPISRFFEWIGI